MALEAGTMISMETLSSVFASQDCLDGAFVLSTVSVLCFPVLLWLVSALVPGQVAVSDVRPTGVSVCGPAGPIQVDYQP